MLDKNFDVPLKDLHRPAQRCPEKRTERKKPTPQQAAPLRLPMPRAQVDELVLKYRSALEAARQGYSDAPLRRRLYMAVLLTRFLTDAGHGRLPLRVLEEADQQLATTFEHGNKRGTWDYSPDAIALLTQGMSEHDRQLRETPCISCWT